MSLSVLEPAEGRKLVAVSLSNNMEPPLNKSWSPNVNPSAFAAKTGLRWSAYDFIQEIPETSKPLFELIDETTTDAALFLTVIPTSGSLLSLTVGWGRVFPEMLKELASRCEQFNKNGRAVFLRFAPEMNVPWHIWGMQPEAFKRNWDILATELKALPSADRTALVWSPFDGASYPYLDGTKYRYMPANGTSSYLQLDTNQDGRLDGSDDPYEPFFPTNESTLDWVGLTVYWSNNVIGYNSVSPPDQLSKLLTGQVNAKPNFYQRYSVDKDVPMMLSATGAVFYKGKGIINLDVDEISVKSSWWKQWLSASFTTQFPRIKMFCLAEMLNEANDNSAGTWFDFRLGADPKIWAAFHSDLEAASAPGSNFQVAWSHSANLTTWIPPTVGQTVPPTQSRTNSTDLTSITLIVGLVCIPVLVVAMWIGYSFYKNMTQPPAVQTPSNEEAKSETPDKDVDDNSTIWNGASRPGSFGSQFTTSDEVFRQSDEAFSRASEPGDMRLELSQDWDRIVVLPDARRISV
ncbi:hypothetical protein HDU91_006317 [Kappamyces sp. JEL0680]|nr:hypothetical protein HDU91_006317 [Kappamyces sp. JEL0680]